MKHFAYLDIEASHTNWHDAEIIEIAFIIKDENGSELDFFQSLIRPQKEINEEITELTGISKRMLQSAPEFNRVALKVYEKLQDCIIVAHKVEFDFNLLNKELAPLGLELDNKKICTLKLSQRLIPELKSYTLNSLCQMLFIPHAKEHRAMDDAQALMELHLYLRMLNGELTEKENFLKKHQDLILKTAALPGVIKLKLREDKKTKIEFFKSENLQKKLKELLELNIRNYERLSKLQDIRLFTCASLMDAGLLLSRLQKEMYPFCIYKVKNQKGKELLRIGKTQLNKKALYYVKSKHEAKKIIQKIVKKTIDKKLIYQDSQENPSEIVKENIKLNKELNKLIGLQKNYLIRSSQKIDGKYKYILIKKNNSFCEFETSRLINKSDDLLIDKLKFKPMGPREYMAFNHSLQWIKNQRSKTDVITEMKQF